MPDSERRKLYRSITKDLGRVKKDDKFPRIPNPGKVAGLLIETFLDHDGILKAITVENKGLCEKNGFMKWKEPLVAKGWLVYEHGSYSKHMPGAMMNKHLNKYNFENELLATKKDVDRVAFTVDEHNIKFNEIQKKFDEYESLIKKIGDMVDPPYDGREDEVKTNLKNGVYDNKLELIKNSQKRPKPQFSIN